MSDLVPEDEAIIQVRPRAPGPAVSLPLTDELLRRSPTATIFHYRPWGWIVTSFLSVLSCLAIHHLFQWAKHRQAMLKLVANPKVNQVDYVLLVVGMGFLALALFVY